MIDFIAIASAFNSAAGGLKDVVSLFKDLRGRQPKPEEISMAFERVLAAQEAVLDTKQMVFALQEENADLKKRLDECQQFQVDKDKLELRSVAPGAFAYVDKTVDSPYVGVPWYCQHCLDDRKKSVFQFAQREFGFDLLKCYACDAEIKKANGVDVLIASTGGRTNFNGF